MGFFKDFAKGFGEGYLEQRGIEGTIEDIGSLAKGIKNIFSDDSSDSSADEEDSVFDGYNENIDAGNYQEAVDYVKEYYKHYSLQKDYVYFYLLAQAQSYMAYMNDDMNLLNKSKNNLDQAKARLSKREDDYEYLVILEKEIAEKRKEIQKSLERSSNWDKTSEEINEFISENDYDRAFSILENYYNKYEDKKDFWYYHWRAFIYINQIETESIQDLEKDYSDLIRKFNSDLSKAVREDTEDRWEENITELKNRFDSWEEGYEEIKKWDKYMSAFIDALETPDINEAEHLFNSYYNSREKDCWYWKDRANLFVYKGLYNDATDKRTAKRIQDDCIGEAENALNKFKSMCGDDQKDVVDELVDKCNFLKERTVSLHSGILAEDGMFDAAKKLLDDFFTTKDYCYYQPMSRNESMRVEYMVKKGNVEKDKLKEYIKNAEDYMNLALSMAPDDETRELIKTTVSERINIGKKFLEGGGPTQQPTTSTTVTAAHPDESEQEYITELKACYEDGEISDRERRLLDFLRKSLGISEDRAKALEAMCNPTAFTKDEEEYVEELKAILEDGIISDRERRLLNRLAKSLNISESRAMEIETIITEK